MTRKLNQCVGFDARITDTLKKAGREQVAAEKLRGLVTSEAKDLYDFFIK